MYLYAKDLYEAKYQLLINKCEIVGFKLYNDSKAFMEYSVDMDDIYENIEEYKRNKEHKIMIIFDDMIADMLSNKKLQQIVTELFTRSTKQNIPLVFITQSYFLVPKNIRQNSTYYFIMKISDKRELQQVAFNHTSDIDFKDFMNRKDFTENHIVFS